MSSRRQTQTGGSEATGGWIPGEVALSVGMPPTVPLDGFRWVALTDVARLETGHTPSRREPDYWGGKIPWIGIRDATANHGRTIFQTNERITELGEQKSSTRILPTGTVCLSRTASIGYVIQMGSPMCTSQDFVNWVCSPDLQPEYLKYILMAERESFLRFAHGTTHQTIYFPEVKAFHVLLPSSAEQRAIAGVLGALDDKIESNRRIVGVIQDLLACEFRKILGDNSTSTSLRDSVPRLNKVVRTGPFGSNLHASDYGDHGVPLILVKHVVRGAVANSGLPLVQFEKANELENYALKRNDIVVTRVGRVGDAALVREHQVGWLFSGQMLRIRLGQTDPIDPFWLSQWYQTIEFRELISAFSVGSTRESLSTSILGDAPIPHVDTARQKSFRLVAEPLHDRWSNATVESDSLAKIRDSLLPELLSGRIRVRDAESIVEEVL